MSSPSPSSPKTMRIAVAASALLVVAGLAAFWYASTVARQAPPKAADNAVTVTIRGNVCEPNEITVPAGRTTFTIVNQSQRALEWEILDGVMVVEERENIAPGFSQTMTVKLQPGEFDITCGLLSNPRGKLRVTPSAASDAEAARPSLVNYVGALAEYRVFLALESGDLEEAVGTLNTTIDNGKLEHAQAAYLAAHRIYKRIEPMGDLFADLDTRLNARAEYFERREADPGFSGFYRIEHGLFVQRDTATLKPVAQQLQQDVATLQTRLAALQIPPERLAASAARLLRRIADTLPADAEHDHGGDLSNLQGTYEGTRKIADLLTPLLSKAAPDRQQQIDARFAEFDRLLAPYRDGDANTDAIRAVPLDAAQRKQFAAALHALSDALAGVNAALGLE